MIGFIVRLRSRAHFRVEVKGKPPGGTISGSGARRTRQARQRLTLLIAAFAVMYVTIGARLIQYGMADPSVTGAIAFNAHAMASRPDIVDRNGELLATDINTVSLYAEPRKIVDANEVVE